VVKSGAELGELGILAAVLQPDQAMLNRAGVGELGRGGVFCRIHSANNRFDYTHLTTPGRE